ncbi:MAG TPA: adenosine deaminase [Acidimicrobiales bacterium]|nr:adenosine deaminase [Acidimicrobiales bacterium]
MRAPSGSGPASDADIATLPKVELHLHIEGTLEPELIFALAERNKIPLPYGNVERLRARYRFSNLSDFLDLYYENTAVLRREEDFYDLARAYFARARADAVRHVEIFVDPQAHTIRGIPLEAALGGVGQAVSSSARDFGVTSGLIVNFLRDRTPEEAIAMLRRVLRLDVPVIGVGLDSAEAGNPPAKFASVFALAHASGLRCVAHAGEEGPPAYVWEALDLLRVSRVDHGVRSLEDEALVDRLAAAATPLTVCPLSNVVLGVFPSLADHPVVDMLARGLHVTINSDDPAYFGGYIGENYRQLVEAFALDRPALARLASNGIAAAFIEPHRRSTLIKELAQWETSSLGPP